jgi:putative transposase
MTLKFHNKYRVDSARLRGYDYSRPGAYFITICTKNRVHYFGKIIDGKMALNNIGKIVECEWIRSFDIRKELLHDEWIVMPDHIHGIVIIINGGRSLVETHSRASLPFERKPRSISSFVAGFKSAVTKQINDMGRMQGGSIWQSRFNDHIIRNADEMNRIRQYIANNPMNWLDNRKDSRSNPYGGLGLGMDTEGVVGSKG